MSEEFQGLWAAVRGDLALAREALPDSTDDELRPYEQLLAHNELGLALDALVDVAAHQCAPAEVWTRLSKAAQTMGIEPNDDTHGVTVQTIMARRAAAHE